jgi:hypothetical protein
MFNNIISEMKTKRKRLVASVLLILLLTASVLLTACPVDYRYDIDSYHDRGLLNTLPGHGLFSYHFGSYSDGYQKYDIYMFDGEMHFSYTGMYGVEPDITGIIETSVLDKIITILKDHDMFSWVEFEDIDACIQEDYGFELALDYRGTKLTVSAYEELPKGYPAAHDTLASYLTQVAEKLDFTGLNDISEISYIAVTMPEGIRISVSMYELYRDEIYPIIHYEHDGIYRNYTVNDVGCEKFDEFIELIWFFYSMQSNDPGDIYDCDDVQFQIAKYDKETNKEVDLIFSINDSYDAEEIKEMSLGLVGKTLRFLDSEEFLKEKEDAGDRDRSIDGNKALADDPKIDDAPRYSFGSGEFILFDDKPYTTDLDDFVYNEFYKDHTNRKLKGKKEERLERLAGGEIADFLASPIINAESFRAGRGAVIIGGKQQPWTLLQISLTYPTPANLQEERQIEDNYYLDILTIFANCNDYFVEEGYRLVVIFGRWDDDLRWVRGYGGDETFLHYFE